MELSEIISDLYSTDLMDKLDNIVEKNVTGILKTPCEDIDEYGRK